MQVPPPAPIRSNKIGTQGKQPMTWFVYILQCSDNSLYTGITWNLAKRLREHNSGVYQSFTRSRRPVKLVYWERLPGKIEAAKREREIKGWTRIKKEKLISSLH